MSLRPHFSKQQTPPSKKSRGVHMVELDVRADEGEFRPQPEGEKITLQLGRSPGQVVYLGRTLPAEQRLKLETSLRENRDLFAWSAADMPGIDPSVICHKLTTNPGAKPVAQRRRKMGADRIKEVASKVAELLEAGFIREITYTTWLANVVMVKKPSGKWRMCVDYTNLNKIPMYPPDQEKTAFITDQAAYCYTVMPFGLKNAGATYQRMMSKVFDGQIGDHMEVYMDDMIAKSLPGEDHVSILESIFKQLRKYNMRLNPEKCTFGVEAGKFLGFLLTSRGIEANPAKCQAIISMRSPHTVKEVQQLNGRLAALSRFLPSAAKHSLPLFQLLRKSKKFEWSAECEAAFQTFKQYLAAPPILSKPEPDEVLFVYLAVSDEAVAAVLIKETADGQNPVYFISKALQGPELRYQKLEKVAYALLVATRRLRQYFQSHATVVRTNQPIRQILHKPELAGRMIAWSVELSQFDIRFEPRTAIKSQVLSDFVAEMTAPVHSEQLWTIYVDGSSNPKGSGAGVLLEDGQGVTIEHSLTFTFQTSNNQAEYEACIAGLQLAKEVGAQKILICSDSQLAVSQITGTYQVKDPLLGKYLIKVKELMANFVEATIQHVPRENNTRADILSKLASTKSLGNNRSVVQGTIYQPSVMTVEQVVIPDNWTGPFIRYILHGSLPADPKDKQRFLRCCAWYTLIQGTLYRRGFSTPLLKCLGPERADYVLREIHEGSCGHHLGAASLAKKVLRAGYYWPTVEKDATILTRKCTRCQLFADLHKAPPEELTTTQSPWPFCRWGMDILGPFPQAPGQLKFLIVAIDYFTKWIEAEALATITSANIQKFTWRNIITRFGIPATIVTDNGTQFADRRFQELLSGLHIKQRFTSVEHPQTNGQAEAANKVILKGIKKRLDESKGNWPDHLHHVLWAYRTTPHSTTGESPFNLTYGSEAMIPVEIGEPTWRTVRFNEEGNQSLLRNNLDEVEEVREKARLREATIKQKTAAKYNSSVVPRQFSEGALVLRRADVGKVKGKLGPNWEGPYRVTCKIGKGAYKLQELNGREIPRTWNAANLRLFYA
ncbi:unnamed protein product [Lupinus luteus]|uniref:Uncharacterized protein n=1 Tax=Lupinus luteus TaxID=3873 RepID=A0AAV1X006_LUPLU